MMTEVLFDCLLYFLLALVALLTMWLIFTFAQLAVNTDMTGSEVMSMQGEFVKGVLRRAFQ